MARNHEQPQRIGQWMWMYTQFTGTAWQGAMLSCSLPSVAGQWTHGSARWKQCVRVACNCNVRNTKKIQFACKFP